MRFDAILILGHRLLPGDRPSDDLKRRIDCAVRLWREEGAGCMMPCGGLTPGRNVTEAEVMRDMLAERGIPRDAIRLEDASRITIENVVNASRLLPKGARVALVTSDYHLERAMDDLRRAGIDAVGVGAETPPGPYRDAMFEKERVISREFERLRAAGLTEDEISRLIVERVQARLIQENGFPKL